MKNKELVRVPADDIDPRNVGPLAKRGGTGDTSEGQQAFGQSMGLEGSSRGRLFLALVAIFQLSAGFRSGAVLPYLAAIGSILVSIANALLAVHGSRQMLKASGPMNGVGK